MANEQLSSQRKGTNKYCMILQTSPYMLIYLWIIVSILHQQFTQ